MRGEDREEGGVAGGEGVEVCADGGDEGRVGGGRGGGG